jgi:hypothetical protein
MITNLDFKTIQALWVLGLILRDDLPEIAAQVMVQGANSKSLEKLAGLSQTDTREALELFERSLDEMGQKKITKKEALRIYAKYISGLILASQISPLEGANRIWRSVVSSGIIEFHDLDPFIYAASEWESRPEEADFFQEAIRKEAEIWSKFK